MSTETENEAVAADLVAPSIVAPIAADLKPAASIPGGDKDPAWLPGRIEQAKRAERAAILAELGIEDPKAGKEAIAAYRAHQEANKTELQRAMDRAAALEPLAKERDIYRARVEVMTSSELAALAPEQRTVVESIAGNDPIKIADTIALLKPTWARSAIAPPVAPPAPPLPTAPANAAPSGSPPPKPGAVKTKYDEWQDLETSGKRNAANMFYSAHAGSIEQTRPVS